MVYAKTLITIANGVNSQIPKVVKSGIIDIVSNKCLVAAQRGQYSILISNDDFDRYFDATKYDYDRLYSEIEMQFVELGYHLHRGIRETFIQWR